MATIKPYTDLEQSKKLEEILPLESADMYWNNASIRGVDYVDAFHLEPLPYKDVVDTSWVKSHKSVNPMFEVVPAWSLSALMKILPMVSTDKDIANPFIAKASDNEYYLVYATSHEEIYASSLIFDNPIDACVDMILTLKERKLL